MPAKICQEIRVYLLSKYATLWDLHKNKKFGGGLEKTGYKQKKFVDNVDNSVYNCFFPENGQVLMCITFQQFLFKKCG